MFEKECSAKYRTPVDVGASEGNEVFEWLVSAHTRWVEEKHPSSVQRRQGL
jgi:hypothetical protein